MSCNNWVRWLQRKEALRLKLTYLASIQHVFGYCVTNALQIVIFLLFILSLAHTKDNIAYNISFPFLSTLIEPARGSILCQTKTARVSLYIR